MMMQEHWRFENAIAGIAVREDFIGEPCDCDRRLNEPQEECCLRLDKSGYAEGIAANDVFIVEGQQERYCDKGAWVVARR